jgi:hypothetical protein
MRLYRSETVMDVAAKRDAMITITDEIEIKPNAAAALRRHGEVNSPLRAAPQPFTAFIAIAG